MRRTHDTEVIKGGKYQDGTGLRKSWESSYQILVFFCDRYIPIAYQQVKVALFVPFDNVHILPDFTHDTAVFIRVQI